MAIKRKREFEQHEVKESGASPKCRCRPKRYRRTEAPLTPEDEPVHQAGAASPLTKAVVDSGDKPVSTSKPLVPSIRKAESVASASALVTPSSAPPSTQIDNTLQTPTTALPPIVRRASYATPYDPLFGQKVSERMELSLKFEPFVLHLRIQKYGEDVAKEYRNNHTPQHIRDAWQEEQDRDRPAWLDMMTEPSTDDESDDGDCPNSERPKTIAEWNRLQRLKKSLKSP